MADTREALLQAGVDLYGTTAGDLLKGLSAVAVAQQGGFHRQTFYRYWDTQADYTQDLIRYVLRVEHAPAANGAEVLQEERQPPDDPAAFFRNLADHDFPRVVADPQAALRITLLMMEVLAEPPYAGLTQDYYDETMSRMAAAYERLLEQWDLTLPDDVDARDLARLLQALLLGLTVQARAAEDDPPASRLFERAAGLLLEGLTRTGI